MKVKAQIFEEEITGYNHNGPHQTQNSKDYRDRRDPRALRFREFVDHDHRSLRVDWFTGGEGAFGKMGSRGRRGRLTEGKVK